MKRRCCRHWDRYECFVLRYLSTSGDREEVEQEARLCGGCECACHSEDEDGNTEWDKGEAID